MRLHLTSSSTIGLLIAAILCSMPTLGMTSAATAHAADPLTGIWHGTYVNDDDVPSDAYLEVTENADGSLSGRWGNGPNGALVIEHGERVTKSVFQWEAASEAHQDGRYRIRARLIDGTLHLDVTYTWRQDGKINGQTAVSTLSRT